MYNISPWHRWTKPSIMIRAKEAILKKVTASITLRVTSGYIVIRLIIVPGMISVDDIQKCNYLYCGTIRNNTMMM
jgi:hypothetical protein